MYMFIEHSFGGYFKFFFFFKYVWGGCFVLFVFCGGGGSKIGLLCVALAGLELTL